MKWSVVFLAFIVILSIKVEAAKLCSSGIWKPSPGMPWMWQIGSLPSNAQIDTTNAQVIDMDMFSASESLISYIHSKGKAVICYIDTAFEPGRPDSSAFTAAVKGHGLDGWPGQYWVDIRSTTVRNIMTNRAQLALAKGCDAIEWDDVDAYANTNGLNLQSSDQIDFNKFLAQITHAAGMSVGLKNDLDQVNDLVNYFDWALNEQCYQYSECSVLSAFVKQNKAVFGTEYQGAAATFCPIQNGLRFSWLKSTLDLDGSGVTQCCSYQSPACAPVTYTCIIANGTSTSPTPAPTTKPTSAPPTTKPTDKPTSAPPTTKPTDKPTSAPPTTKPTDKPTSAPPTSRPTDKPTSAPTSKPTDKPTSAPVTSAPVTPTPTVSAAKSLKIRIHSGASGWWFAVTLINGDAASKVELKDSGSVIGYTAFTQTNWGYWIFPSTGQSLQPPLSIKVTSTSGKSVLATISQISGGIVVDSGVALS